MLSLYSNLRGLLGVEDELSEIIDQVLKVSLEGVTVHYEVAISIMKSILVSRPRSL